MFENIIGQPATVAALRAELEAGGFPRAALFAGPPWAGKLSAALEAARVLTCTGDRSWGCWCTSCRQQRELVSPWTVLLGWRSGDVEIAAAAAALGRDRGASARIFLLRAVRKLLRRFDPAVWDADEARLRAARERIDAIEEALAPLAPELPLPADGALGTALERVVGRCAELAASVRNDRIGVAQVRLLASWLRVGAEPRVAILENADGMQESARNALLKLLEEPPAAAHLILLTSRRAALAPTLQSRLRTYLFRQRSPEEEREVISRVFREDPSRYPDLRAFFLAWREVTPEALQAAARRFLALAAEPGPGLELPPELEPFAPRRQPGERTAGERALAERTLSLLDEIAGELEGLLARGEASPDLLAAWSAALRECRMRLEVLNVSTQNALVGLLARLRGASA